jgi:hypothetical protein
MLLFLYSLSLLNALVFLVIAGFHYYWALGGRYGFSAALPEIEHSGRKAFIPGKLATAVVATLFLGVALLFAGLLPVPAVAYHYGFWAVAGITLLRACGDFNYVGFFKKKSHTIFARYDSRYFSPLCLYLALSSAALAWFGY